MFNIQQKRHNTVQHTKNAIWHIAGCNSCVESWTIFLLFFIKHDLAAASRS